MKKLVLLFATVCMSLTAMADEGMWLLPYLQKMNIRTMKEKGCKLSAEEIYNINKGSLKDAIVIFGGGCTGEIVSPEGLLFTNHHCGYGSIQSLSSVEKDYLKNGFWAMSTTEEIPAPGLEVRFIRTIADVTAEVLRGVPNIAGGEERENMVKEHVSVLKKELEAANPGMEIIIKPFFGGNQYFSFVVEVYRDVRLVGTPPTSIGKFGGDTDNWMWPRHTGDFSVFRVYAGVDNRPADYSTLNRPYKTKEYLKVSLDGIKEGDFAMIMGFPGSTQRYMTSFEIDRMLDVENPQRIFIRGERQSILKQDMLASDKVRIQYAAKYAASSNYWKNSIGMSRGIKKLNIKAKKQAQEAEFQRWAEANTLPEEGYIDALNRLKRSVEASLPAVAKQQYLNESFLRAMEILNIAANTVAKLDSALREQRMPTIKDEFRTFYKNYNEATDRRVAQRMVEIVRENMKELPSFYVDEIDAKFGGNMAAYVDFVYDNSIFANEKRAMAFLDNVSKEVYENDPAVVMLRSIRMMYNKALSVVQEQNLIFNDAHRLYIAGLMHMRPDKAWASDANFTLRLTYGQVLPYDPADGIRYNYYTTLKGVIDKEDASNPTEFTVSEKIKKLYEARDFGGYANEKGELPVGFLANCDITGGNSGSPVLNGRGELIGLAFDGNWEAMSGDVAFEPELQRTISVDVCYVLFVIDKFADAGWLLNEMDIVKKKR